MKRFAVYLLLCSLMLPTIASATIVEHGQAMYTGGTIPTVKEGTMGRLDTTSQTTLVFDAAATKIAIPYAKIEEFQYSRELARHLGVLPTIAVGLLKHRQRRHFFRIAFTDENQVRQVVVFEVSKEMPRTLAAILKTRTPGLCSAKSSCGFQPEGDF